MIEQDDEKSPNSLRYYAPRRPREADGQDEARSDSPAPSASEPANRLALAADHADARARRDMFSEAVARAERQRLDPEFVAARSFAEPRRRSRMGLKVALVAIAVGSAGIAYVVTSPMSAAKLRSAAAWSVFRAGYLTGTPAASAPTLIVSGNNGPLNAQLGLGVTIEHPAVGMVVIVGKLPLGTRITVGRRLGAEEWRVPALDIADAVIVPPTDFAGEMNLSLELHDADGATLVRSFVHLTWTAPPSPVVVTGSTAAETKVSAAQEPPPVAAPTAVPIPANPLATPQPAAPDPVLAWTPNEVAAFVRRAQELLASGEVQAARLQLLRAAEARDSRAALLLAKTYDPVSLKQFGVSDAGTDLAQARTWYQRAREWGSPEAQRQLDALASYPRR
ncbi:conserved hypothetical protein [Bradyrhizobium sp. ORS 375]|uniref:hypothetical protein n=1 Tax=Bradyrhizobium sp. (strain ORS 375) TaxID=566679 RepID=UPI00024085B3|nr:hypothetical protein [Bradyrhizobium sp. ORS 375]CCD93238.1 conserved hypothetical protein [Bradyrhizobium sp. ORS 375]